MAGLDLGAASAAQADMQPAFTLPAFDFDMAIAAHAQHRRGDAAFIDEDRVRTWGEFDRRIACIAEALVRAGLAPGERVALLAANSFWAYEVMFGIARAGAVIVPLSTLHPPALIAKLLKDSDTRYVFAGRGYEGAAAQALAALGTRLPLVIEDAHSAGDEREQGGSEQHEAEQHEAEQRAWGAQYCADFALGCSGAFRAVARDPRQTFTIIYSSGTTGVPKGIMHSIAGRLGLAWQFGAALGVTAQARSLIATPPSSNGSMILLLPTLYAGGVCILSRSLDPAAFFRAVEQQRMTHAFLVPTQFKAIFEDAYVSQANFGSVRCLLSVGAPMPAQLKQRVLRRAGHCFHEAWGFTEGVATLIHPGEVAHRPQSVGRPLPGTELRIIDGAGRELQPPSMGEIVGRSTMMMQGYLNRSDANADIRWTDAQGTVFLRTGDVGELDADGFLSLRGRLKDMIISGGLNVYPADIEAVLLEHPQVADVAVVGVPDERWGEVPVAFVITSSGAHIDSEDLKSWTNRQVAKHRRLARIVLHEADFPRNALGKVLKGELRASYFGQRDMAHGHHMHEQARSS